VTDDGDGSTNTLGGANSHPDFGIIFDGDRYDNEDGDDLTQTGVAESLDGLTTYASGKMYLEERYTLTKPGGGTIDVFRVEVDGLHVGYITIEPLVPGTNYSYTTSNVVPLNAPDATDPNILVNVPCFTSGTLIKTPTGEQLIDALKVGDLVTTMDNGPQKIRGVLGAKADLLVSPQHGILTGESHLIRAKHLAKAPRSRVRIANGKRSVTYIHLFFDRHQVIFSNGVASESLFPGQQAVGTFNPDAREELFTLFPELANYNQPKFYPKSYGKRARDFTKSFVPS